MFQVPGKLLMQCSPASGTQVVLGLVEQGALTMLLLTGTWRLTKAEVALCLG